MGGSSNASCLTSVAPLAIHFGGYTMNKPGRPDSAFVSVEAPAIILVLSLPVPQALEFKPYMAGRPLSGSYQNVCYR